VLSAEQLKGQVCRSGDGEETGTLIWSRSKGLDHVVEEESVRRHMYRTERAAAPWEAGTTVQAGSPGLSVSRLNVSHCGS
jgi:hypothetical protein